MPVQDIIFLLCLRLNVNAPYTSLKCKSSALVIVALVLVLRNGDPRLELRNELLQLRSDLIVLELPNGIVGDVELPLRPVPLVPVVLVVLPSFLQVLLDVK